MSIMIAVHFRPKHAVRDGTATFIADSIHGRKGDLLLHFQDGHLKIEKEKYTDFDIYEHGPRETSIFNQTADAFKFRDLEQPLPELEDDEDE